MHTYQPSRDSLDHPGIWGMIQGSGRQSRDFGVDLIMTKQIYIPAAL